MALFYRHALTPIQSILIAARHMHVHALQARKLAGHNKSASLPSSFCLCVPTMCLAHTCLLHSIPRTHTRAAANGYLLLEPIVLLLISSC